MLLQRNADTGCAETGKRHVATVKAPRITACRNLNQHIILPMSKFNDNVAVGSIPNIFLSKIGVLTEVESVPCKD